MDKVFEVFLLILCFGLILFLAYLTTRLVAGKTNKAMRGKYINIIETINLGGDKRLYLLKVEKQFILISSCGKSIEFLSNVEIENFEETVKSMDNHNVLDFRTLFEKYTGTNKNDKVFKFNLDRLKNITKGISKQGTNSEDKNTDEKTDEKE